ncbi:hypothetical protein SDC9_169100 [bioreactor metagenome]|uniref:Uncharacterized protein n=1 Tax=bioreactor metagenome TaxID=1076179 RepID=A0A645G6X5_9ZZZZ
MVAILRIDHRHTQRALGVALHQQHQGAEPVFMLGDYLYDVPFYARLADPVHVVGRWSDPQIALRDNWRKELADAGAFDTALAQQVLVEPQALPADLCSHKVSWLLAPASGPRHPAFLNQSSAIRTSNGFSLWRVESERLPSLNCSGTPNAGSADR